MENHTAHTDRPLGFWLRAVDGLISREFAAAFEGEPVDRRDAMILNALDRSASDEAARSGAPSSDAMRAHLARRPKRLVRLAELGWITATDGAWALTAEGRAAQERLHQKIDAVRERVAAAMPEEDLATTLRTLEAIAHELGDDDDAQRFGVRGHRHGHHHGGLFGARHGGHEHGHAHEHEHGHAHAHGHHRDHGLDPAHDRKHGHDHGPHLRRAC